MVDSGMDRFMYVKDDVFSMDECAEIIQESQHFIQNYDRNDLQQANSIGRGADGGDIRLRHDTQLYLERAKPDLFFKIVNRVTECLPEYNEVCGSLSGMPLTSYVGKYQHTPVCGGFGNWHAEHGSASAANRVLVWMVYLNDVTDGGETEFVYQKCKVTPKAGRVVIWPAAFTHSHRGNPPYSNDKHVVTGWYELPPADAYLTGLQG